MTQPPRSPSPSADDALAARLQALAERRASAPPAKGPARGQANNKTKKSGRRHPARQARFTAVGLTIASTASLTGWFMASAAAAPHQLSSATVVRPSTTPGSPAPTSTPSVSTTTPGISTSQQAPTTTTPPTTPPLPTKVDGGVFHNRWGDVQVEVTFDPDGSIVDIIALRTPDSRSRSVQINDYAIPRLADESISIQGANVHTIGGATYTSRDYQRSLQSAIDAAREAGVTTLS